MGTIFLNTKNITLNKPDKFVLNLPQRLDLTNSNKHVSLLSLFQIYYIGENIRQKYKNNKLIIIASLRKDEFELPEDSCSVSYVQD